MKRYGIFFIIFFTMGILLFTACQKKETDETIVLEALTIGPGPVPVTRAENLETAAEKIRSEGVDFVLNVTFSELKFGPYRESFSLSFESEEAPDILGEDQDIIPEYAEANMILPLDAYLWMDDWQKNFDDFLPALWDAVTWKGKIYGIPIEGVVNCIYYRKDVLRKLGMTDEDMDSFFSGKNEDFTLEKMVELAGKAKEAGLVEWGFTHRKGPGDYLFNSVMMFGGEFTDRATSNMVIDTEALRKSFNFHKMLVDEELLPPDMFFWEWNKIHKYTVEGKALFWIGGHSGQWKEYQNKAYHENLGTLSEEYLQQNLGIAPFPGIDGPVTPVKVHAYTMVSTTKNRDLSFEILSRAVSTELLSLHSITTFRGPARRSVAEQPVFKNEKFLIRVSEIMQYTRAFPKHPSLGMYKSIIYEAMSGIESGDLTVDQALDFMVSQAKKNIPEVIIR